MDDVIASESRAIAKAVAGATMVSVLARAAENHPDVPAQIWEENGKRRLRSWREYRNEVATTTLGLMELGFKVGDMAVIIAPTGPEHAIADMALVHAGAVPISVYDTMSPQQIADLVKLSGAQIAFIDTARRANELRSMPELRRALKWVVLFDMDDAPFECAISWRALQERGRSHPRPEEFEERASRVRPDNLLTVVCTSGTTGTPKAVKFTHHCVLWQIEACRRRLALEPGEVLLSHMPMAHGAERRIVHWESIYSAASVYYKSANDEMEDVLVAARPHLFFATPRVWEKLREVMVAKLEHAAPHSPSGSLLKSTGLDRCRAPLIGGAPSGQDLLDFLRAHGLPLSNAWGSTEAGLAVTWWMPGGSPPGTVGVPIPGREVQIADDGEILVRDAGIAAGYLNDEAATREVFTEDGWVRMGDIAEINEAGAIKIVGRKKDLIITRGGKNISPTYVEAILEESALISKACVVGDGERYLVALLLLSALARVDSTIIDKIRKAVADANGRLSRPEQIKRFFVVDGVWSVSSGEFNQMLKMNRKFINEKYREIITNMYEGKVGSEPIQG